MQLGFDTHFYKGKCYPKYVDELEKLHNPKYVPLLTIPYSLSLKFND